MPTSWSEARALKAPYYFTGIACKHGHVANRRTQNGTCVECHKAVSRAAYKKDPSKAKARGEARWADPIEREKQKARIAEWFSKNTERETARRKRYYQENKAKFIEDKAIRDGRLKQRSWNHERKAIANFYRNTPEGYHVDHDIPINHPLVCGLHCIANLQYLPAKDNLSKHNSWTPE